MFAYFSASYDWLLLARLRHYHKGTCYGNKLRMRKRLAAVLPPPGPFQCSPNTKIKVTSCDVFIRPCGNTEWLAIKRNIWGRSPSYEAVCFDIF